MYRFYFIILYEQISVKKLNYERIQIILFFKNHFVIASTVIIILSIYYDKYVYKIYLYNDYYHVIFSLYHGLSFILSLTDLALKK